MDNFFIYGFIWYRQVNYKVQKNKGGRLWRTTGQTAPRGLLGKEQRKINCPGGEDVNGNRKGMLVLR